MSNENQPPVEATGPINHSTEHAAVSGAEPAPRPGRRDRTFGLPGLVAVGIGALVLGGLGGTAIGFALDDPGRGDYPVQMGGNFPGGPGMHERGTGGGPGMDGRGPGPGGPRG